MWCAGGVCVHAHTYDAYRVMASKAKANLLFCPPESDRIGRMARSPLMPNEPSWCLYSSSFLPVRMREEKGVSIAMV